MAGLRRALVAIAAALALADASIVALALPPILVEMDTTITGVAAIIGVYALVLALAILPAARLGAGRAGPAGMALFALASAGCAVAGSLELLLVFRALQAAGGAAALLAAFQLLDAGESRTGRRLWLGAALVGTAAGPAIGGVLTEVFDWRAIFAVQVPIAAAAAIACLRPATQGDSPPPTTPLMGTVPMSGGDLDRAPLGSLAALAFTAAAFTAVLFLLVIELVAGFAISPLRAALGVSVLPVAALAGAAIPGPARARALAGAVLLAGGAAALAFLPAPGIAWTIVPQLLAGAGMGLALPAFSGGLLPERTVPDAARGLVARHVGHRRRARDPRAGRHEQARGHDGTGDPAGHVARARRADRAAGEAPARAGAARRRRRRRSRAPGCRRRSRPGARSSPTTPRSTTGSRAGWTT